MINTTRTFIPGSECVYFKIYTGIKTADKILDEDVSLIINKLKKKKLIHKWFFIRYNDPDFHLRIRVFVKDKFYITDVINIFHRQLNRLLKNKEIWKVQLDTYDRELERYGYELIEEAESLFCIDSECVLSVIKSIRKFNFENYRWIVGMRMVDELLNDFSYDLNSKKNLMNFLNASYKKEFNFNDKNLKQFSVKYRENKKDIELMLAKDVKNATLIQLVSSINGRTKKLQPVIKAINCKLINNKEYNIDTLLASYIHMTLNRLFRSKNRVYELLIYDFMYMYYSGEIARKQKINSE
jgi:thiopeptide-type bacteriocin biosynthesis protein